MLSALHIYCNTIYMANVSLALLLLLLNLLNVNLTATLTLFPEKQAGIPVDIFLAQSRLLIKICYRSGIVPVGNKMNNVFI